MYRGDSFLCGAAIHAGIVRDQRGGCGIVSLLGENSDFRGLKMNGMESVGFNSSFPLSFSLDQGDSSAQRALSQCSDPR
jgi:LCCL domain